MKKRDQPTHTIDKRPLFAQLGKLLAESLARLTAAQASAQAGATDSEAKQEHAKDMRSTEASYVSRGLAERVETLRESIETLSVFRPPNRTPADPIAVGDVITLIDEDEQETHYLLAPVGGGEKLTFAGREFRVVTARAPLGAALIGKQPGDEVTLELSARRRTLEIKDVH